MLWQLILFCLHLCSMKSGQIFLSKIYTLYKDVRLVNYSVCSEKLDTHGQVNISYI